MTDSNSTNPMLTELEDTLASIQPVAIDTTSQKVVTTAGEPPPAAEVQLNLAPSQPFNSGGVSEIIEHTPTELQHTPTQMVQQSDLGYMQIESTPLSSIMSSDHDGVATLIFDQNVETGHVSAIEVQIADVGDGSHSTLSFTATFTSDQADLRNTRITEIAESFFDGFDPNKSMTEQTFTFAHGKLEGHVDNSELAFRDLKLVGGDLESNEALLSSLAETPLPNATHDVTPGTSPDFLKIR